MKKIKIISGTYGHRSKGAAFVEPKTPSSQPFYVSDEEADRLINLGVAAIIGNDIADSPYDEAELHEGETEMVLKGVDAAKPFMPSYSVESKAQELRDIGKDVGITFRVGTSKEEMVRQLDNYFAAESGEGDDEDCELSLTPFGLSV